MSRVLVLVLVAAGAVSAWEHRADLTRLLTGTTAADEAISALEARVGREPVQQYMRAGMPGGYAAWCRQQFGGDPSMDAAVHQFLSRNQRPINRVTASLRAAGGLTARDRQALETLIIESVQRNASHFAAGPQAHCSHVADAIRGGQFDLLRPEDVMNQMFGQ